jgi:hypothetical protein
MDRVDCHNVVAHRVAPTPEQAVDAALAAGRIDRGLPFVRREGVRLMKASHQAGDDAARIIDEDLRKFYTSRGAQRGRVRTRPSLSRRFTTSFASPFM